MSSPNQLDLNPTLSIENNNITSSYEYDEPIIKIEKIKNTDTTVDIYLQLKKLGFNQKINNSNEEDIEFNSGNGNSNNHGGNSRSPSPIQQPSRIVKLNVGGIIYSTSMSTLISDSNSMFYLMFSGRFSIQKEPDGSIFIDRDGEHFHHILNWLRGSYCPVLEDGNRETVLQEAKYYQIQSLIDFLSIPPTKETIDINKFTQKDIIELINKCGNKPIQLASANLSGVDLSGLNLRGANLKFANLEGAILKYANLQESNLQDANLKQCDLRYADLSNSYLLRVQLQNSQCQYANFTNTNLSDAELTESCLQSADFQNAFLSGANLQGTNLQDTNLFGAKMQGTSLYKAVNVQRAKGLKR